jgi:hypothetical protein
MNYQYLKLLENLISYVNWLRYRANTIYGSIKGSISQLIYGICSVS